METSAISSDFDRLGAMTASAVPSAVGLAFLSAATLTLALFPPASMPAVGLIALLVWFHAVFIVTVTWKQLKPGRPLFSCLVSPGLKAGAILAAPIFAFALLDAFGAVYSCAEGLAYGRSPVPNFPWLWIGWTCLALTALPARTIGVAIGEQPPLIPLWRRAILTLPFLPFLWIFGYVFEWREIDCTPPFEGWGLFEGGLFMIPLLGLFWFVASFSLAVLSAACVDQLSLNPVAEQE